MGQNGDAGFLSRWSRRKALARQGEPLPEPPRPAPLPAVAPAPLPEPAPQLQLEPEAPPPPTLDDVAALLPESDYSRFVAGDVQPEVKNAALKKLFTDPHYNLMDGLDTYIDDYSQPDPLPPGMLAQMTQSAFLGLFTEAPVEGKPDTDTTLRAMPSSLSSPGPWCFAATPSVGAVTWASRQ